MRPLSACSIGTIGSKLARIPSRESSSSVSTSFSWQPNSQDTSLIATTKVLRVLRFCQSRPTEMRKTTRVHGSTESQAAGHQTQAWQISHKKSLWSNRAGWTSLATTAERCLTILCSIFSRTYSCQSCSYQWFNSMA